MLLSGVAFEQAGSGSHHAICQDANNDPPKNTHSPDNNSKASTREHDAYHNKRKSNEAHSAQRHTPGGTKGTNPYRLSETNWSIVADEQDRGPEYRS